MHMTHRNQISRRAAPAADPDAELLALGEEFEPLFRRHCKFRGAGPRFEALCDELFPLAEEILAHKATTREGFAVQVLALSVTHGYDLLIYPKEDTQRGDKAVANFITSAASVCGVEDDVRRVIASARIPLKT